MRTDNVLKNGFWGIVYQITSIILGFFGRTVFIYFLNSEYLGISGLFTNILNILSLSEMGFSSAIAFHLYGYLAREDKESITGIMNFYKKVYRVVAVCVLAVGLSVVPFLRFVIKDTSFDITYVGIVYVIYLMNTVVSYLYSYKFTIAIADQKNYILTNISTIFQFLTTIANILSLIIFRNYIIYLIIGIVLSLIGNYCKTKEVSRRYPYLRENTKIDPEVKKKIVADVKNIFAGKLSTVIVTSTDNILISALINISTVGIYSNYSMMIGYVQSFLTQFTSATQASIGNMIASESKEHSYIVLKKLTTIIYFAVSFCSVSLFVLLNPFMNLWLGKEYLLDVPVVVWCVLSFYIQIIKAPVWYSLGGVGYFAQDRDISIIGAVSNLIISIVCAYKWGLSGIFMGTVFSQLIQWVLKMTLFIKKFLEIETREYIALSVKLLLQTIFLCGLTYLICDLCQFSNVYLDFIVKVIMCIVIPNIFNVTLYRKTDAFEYLIGVTKRTVRKFLRRGNGE